MEPKEQVKVDESVDLNKEQRKFTQQLTLTALEMEAEVRKTIETLDLIDRAYFGKDKLKVLRAKIEEALLLLDQKPVDLGKYFKILTRKVQTKKEKAELLYLRGRCLDFIPQYTKQAEEYLSKSIKLAPSSPDAWRALGHVFWKKGDLEQAKQTFEGCLDLNKKDKITLRNLSVVYRQFTTGNDDEPIDIEDKQSNY